MASTSSRSSSEPSSPRPGPLQLGALEIEYEGGEDTWEGALEASPEGAPVGIKGSATFKAGDFVEGKPAVPFDYPGLPVFKAST